MLYSIQLLRFVASLGVVVHHASSAFTAKPFLPTPDLQAGVDLFFVISGFVITLSTRPTDGPGIFIAKRWRRIFPVYWVSTFLMVLFNYWGWRTTPALSELWRSLLLVPDAGMPSWLPLYYPAWTLFYECMFYAVFAFALTISTRPAITAAAIVAVIALCRFHPMGAKGNDTFIALEFVYGVLIGKAWQGGIRLPPKIGAISVVAGVLLLAFDAFPFGRAIQWGIPAALVVGGMTAFEGRRWITNRWVAIGGNASYSLYLVHITAMSWLLQIARLHSIYLTTHPAALFYSMVAVSIAAGALMYFLIERPLLAALGRSLGSSPTKVTSAPKGRPIATPPLMNTHTR